ncbi:unnamed protein product [Kuraishia capsulata CBS 1993]|uniref:Probable cytosolic iron-sulfur protein assembly protein 1 n=1 Tax=Kuraishia capsulata CBS 1993 TaxID=1382522 RepID=W6MHR0_9ASCO|nr:uncharacterized protein KUCA_T00001506001 [Kuraishia capsulata CBS 1993]CDK25536.1 unnamed protein product [Kuraishia capsulata CBS 1993]
MAEISLSHTFKGHSDKCWSTSVHKKYPLLASVSSDKTCRLYNLNTKQLIAILDDDTHSKAVRTVDWKPTGDFPSLAVGSFDSTISIWGREDEDGDEMEISVTAATASGSEWSLMAVIEGHENEVKAVSWSCDGEYLASCSRDKSVWLWETDEANEEFECINVIQDHSQDVKHVVWHPFTKFLATSSYDDTIRLYKQDSYDYDDWINVAVLTGHQGTVWHSDFEKIDPDQGIRLCSGSDDETVRIWKRVSGAELSKQKNGEAIPSVVREDSHSDEWVEEAMLPKVHTGPVYSVSWNKNGLIASASADGRIVVYEETAKGVWRVVAVKETTHGIFEVNSIEWWSSPDGEMLVSAGDDGNVNLWSLSL